jgi:hypothetical protein
MVEKDKIVEIIRFLIPDAVIFGLPVPAAIFGQGDSPDQSTLKNSAVDLGYHKSIQLQYL